MAISVEEARAMTEEQLQETITEIAFEIIANVGTARGMYIEAIQEAKAGNFGRAKELMAEGIIQYSEPEKVRSRNQKLQLAKEQRKKE